MGIKVGIVAESAPGERRGGMVPTAISVLNKTGAALMLEAGGGGERACRGVFWMPTMPRRACASPAAERFLTRQMSCCKFAVRAPIPKPAAAILAKCAAGR